MQKSELTPVDYLGLVQMAMTSPQMGLISSEVKKKTRTEPIKIEDCWQKRPFLTKKAIFVLAISRPSFEMKNR